MVQKGSFSTSISTCMSIFQRASSFKADYLGILCPSIYRDGHQTQRSVLSSIALPLLFVPSCMHTPDNGIPCRNVGLNSQIILFPLLDSLQSALLFCGSVATNVQLDVDLRPKFQIYVQVEMPIFGSFNLELKGKDFKSISISILARYCGRC